MPSSFDVEQYRNNDGDFECPECGAIYEDAKRLFKLHVKYCKD